MTTLTLATFALVLLAFGVGLGLGRFWQRHEHRPHWDELAARDRKIDHWKRLAEERLNERDRIKAQRNKVMEHLRRVQDENAVLKGAPR